MVHPRECDHDTPCDRHGAAAEAAGPGAGYDRNAFLSADARHLRHLFSATWDDDRVGKRGLRAGVVLVKANLVRVGERIPLTDHGLQAARKPFTFHAAAQGPAGMIPGTSYDSSSAPRHTAAVSMRLSPNVRLKLTPCGPTQPTPRAPN